MDAYCNLVLGLKFARFRLPKQASINAFVCYVLNYYAVEFSGLGLTSVAVDGPIYASVAAVIEEAWLTQNRPHCG